jgi:hypothetical protein
MRREMRTDGRRCSASGLPRLLLPHPRPHKGPPSHRGALPALRSTGVGGRFMMARRATHGITRLVTESALAPRRMGIATCCQRRGRSPRREESLSPSEMFVFTSLLI